MTHSITKFFGCLALLSAMTLTSCSSDDAPKATFDEEFATQLSRGEKTVCYQTTAIEQWNEKADGSYEQVNLNDLSGFESLTPGTIIVQDGKAIAELELMRSSGPDAIALPLSAYQKATGKAFKVFLSSDVSLSADNKKLSIGEYESKVLEINDGGMKLETHCDYWDPEDNYEKRDAYQVTTYQTVAFTPIDFERQLICSDRKDAYRKIIALCREQFGNTINLNEVFAPEIQFDNPIIDLDELEKQLLD